MAGLEVAPIEEPDDVWQMHLSSRAIVRSLGIVRKSLSPGQLGLGIAVLLAACAGNPSTVAPTDSEPPASSVSTATATAKATPSLPASRASPLQMSNPNPTTDLQLGQTPPSANRIGDVFPIEWWPADEAPDPADDWSYTHMVDLGLTWAKISLDPPESCWRCDPSEPQPEFNAFQDAMIDLLAERGITMVLILNEWDDGWQGPAPDYGNPADLDRFTAKARAVVRHYADRIDYYEILNEAVIYVELPDYLEVVREVSTIIREEDPGAKVVVGGASSPWHERDREYLLGVVDSDVMPLVDVIALHPFYGMSPSLPETADYYAEYPQLLQNIQVTAISNGFTGSIITEEMAWRTELNDNEEPGVYTDAVAAKYYARAIVWHLGMDVWAGIGGEDFDTIPDIAVTVRNLAWLMDGADPALVAVEVEGLPRPYQTFGFTLPDGDPCIAIWKDGAVIEDAPGTPATLLVSDGVSAQRALALDPLQGVQQELIIETHPEGLTIANLLARDYAILIRLDTG